MRKLLFVFMSLLFVIAGCGRSGPRGASGGGAPKPAANSPEQVVTAYLNAIGRSDYKRAAGYLEHPKAVVWPAISALEETFSAMVPPDVVRLTGVAAGPTLSVSDQGNKACSLARAHIAPSKEAHRWGIGEEGDWRFAFYLIKRNGNWRLARGMPISTELADYLAGNRNLFQNVVSEVPAVAERGKGHKLAFDLHLPMALAFVEEVNVALLPEPSTEKYPYSYEVAFSTYWYGPGRQKNQMGHFDQTAEIDPETPPGKYRIYLGLGTEPPLYWAVPPYVVTVK
jgi:hypothetical protein